MSSDYDVAIVGAGPVGAILARRLGAAGARVLVLEAGPAAGRTWADYQANVEQYRAAGFKVPNSPYYSPADAPSPNVLDIRKLSPGSLPDDTGYFVQDGPLPFATDYQRSQGGTMLHWLGTCLRMVPADFEAASRYGHGRDWPLGYDELDPWYEKAELELGVAANVEDQQYLGLTLPPGLRVSDVPDPAELPRPVRRAHGRRPDRDARRGALRAAGVEHAAGAQLDAQPALRRRQRLPAGRRARRAARGPSLRGQLELHPDLPGAGQVQPAQDLGPGHGRRRGADTVRRVQADPLRPRADLRARVHRVRRRSAAAQAAARDGRSLRAGRQRDRERQAAARLTRPEHQRSDRPQPDGPPVRAGVGADAVRRRRLPRAELDVGDRDPARRRRSARSGRPSGWRSATGAGTSRRSRRTRTSRPRSRPGRLRDGAARPARRPDLAPVPPRLPVRAAAGPAQPRLRQRRLPATRSASRARGSSTTSTTTRAPAWPPPGSCGPSSSTTSGRRTRPSTGRPIPAT